MWNKVYWKPYYIYSDERFEKERWDNFSKQAMPKKTRKRRERRNIPHRRSPSSSSSPSCSCSGGRNRGGTVITVQEFSFVDTCRTGAVPEKACHATRQYPLKRDTDILCVPFKYLTPLCVPPLTLSLGVLGFSELVSCYTPITLVSFEVQKYVTMLKVKCSSVITAANMLFWWYER